MRGPSTRYDFSSFTLDTRDRRLSRHGQEIYLRPKTYDTLLYLLERQGHLVTKNELLDSVWGDVEVTENALTRCIKEARAALGDHVENPRILKTVPRLGYEFIAQVEITHGPANGQPPEGELRTVREVAAEGRPSSRQSEPATAGSASPAAVAATASVRPREPGPFPYIAGSVVVILALAWAAGLFVRRWRERPPGREGAPRISSVAVLPLTNLTGDPHQEYFADGMTEELITRLGEVAELPVISRTSVMGYKKSDKPLPEIARELNADAVVEGSVAREGNRVRITAQLIQGSSDKHLWGKTYERDLRDVLALQSEVAGAIAAEIRAKLAPQQQVRPASAQPVNPPAYLLYLQGKVLWSRGTEQANREAINALERAVATDPSFAPAYAALGRAYADRLSSWQPTEEWNQKTEAAIGKALSLDPDLPEAHVARASLLFTPAHGWQFGEAIQECKRALALNPSLAEGHLMLAEVLDHAGLVDEAFRELQAATAVSPAQPDTAWFTALTLLHSGKFEDALPLLTAVPATPATKSIEAYDLWQLGRKQEARTLVRELLKTDPQERDVWVAGVHSLLLAEAGERDRRITEKTLKQAEQISRYGHFHHVASFVADSYAQLNKPQQAVAWLEKTAANGFPCYPFFEHDHALDPIRQDPRFAAFMQKLKPQWEYFKAKYGSGATVRARDAG